MSENLHLCYPLEVGVSGLRRGGALITCWSTDDVTLIKRLRDHVALMEEHTKLKRIVDIRLASWIHRFKVPTEGPEAQAMLKELYEEFYDTLVTYRKQETVESTTVKD